MKPRTFDLENVEELARDCMAYVLQHGPERETQFNSWLGRRMIRRTVDEYIRDGLIPEDLNSTDPLGVFERARQLLHEYAEKKSTNLERVAAIFDDGGFDAWYLGRHEFSQDQWEATRARLQADDFPNAALEALDRQTEAVMTRLGNPEEAHNRRGLVIGDIQGGKTSHFTGLIASAVDAGYRLVVVLAGTTNSLRLQTQKRVSRHLIDARAESWQPLTYPPGPDEPLSAGEFRRPAANPQNVAAGQAIIAVTKKNAAPLRRLIAWLDSARGVVDGWPILVIDDEADLAGLNTIQGENRRTRINDLIIQLLDRDRVTYVGYTATPYANLLADTRPVQTSHGNTVPGLYPKDFIFALERSPDYFGAERLFGRERLSELEDFEQEPLDVIRLIDPADVKSVLDHEIPGSLARALSYFLLATAARWKRDGEPCNSTMLIHFSARIHDHLAFREPVEELLTALAKRISASDETLLAELRDLWASEVDRVDREVSNLPRLEFGDVCDELARVVNSTRVVVDNSAVEPENRLSYDDSDPCPVVVIGGNTLARGLTLEGLIASYFARTVGTLDTLNQMGRWFGYRRGYEDLPRIWMTERLEEFFRIGATIDAEIREELAVYQDRHTTPAEYGVTLRLHPHIAITSAARRRFAVHASLSYEGRRIQTIVFNRDEATLRSNLDAARSLVASALGGTAVERSQVGSSHVLWGVSATHVTEFFRSYTTHERQHPLLNCELIRRYIEAANDNDRLLTWNVAVISRDPDEQLGSLEIEPLGSVGLINRAPLARRTEYVDIKALMSAVDGVIDCGEIAPEDRRRLRERELSEPRLRDLYRLERQPETGLLLLYPISRFSEPRNAREAGTRARMDADDDLMGFGLIFPGTDDRESDRIQADLRELAPPLSEDELDELQREDEEEAEYVEELDHDDALEDETADGVHR